MAGTSVVSQVVGATDTRVRIGDRVQTGMVVVDGITTDPTVALERRFCLHRTMTHAVKALNPPSHNGASAHVRCG
jgi:hypothetical protein